MKHDATSAAKSSARASSPDGAARLAKRAIVSSARARVSSSEYDALARGEGARAVDREVGVEEEWQEREHGQSDGDREAIRTTVLAGHPRLLDRLANAPAVQQLKHDEHGDRPEAEEPRQDVAGEREAEPERREPVAACPCARRGRTDRS